MIYDELQCDGDVSRFHPVIKDGLLEKTSSMILRAIMYIGFAIATFDYRRGILKKSNCASPTVPSFHLF